MPENTDYFAKDHVLIKAQHPVFVIDSAIANRKILEVWAQFPESLLWGNTSEKPDLEGVVVDSLRELLLQRKRQFHDGKLEGYQYAYFNSTLPLAVSYYEIGQNVWTAFPMLCKGCVNPTRTVKVSQGNCEMKIELESGEMWYQGNFKDFQPIGLHRRYRDGEALMAEIDFGQDHLKSCPSSFSTAFYSPVPQGLIWER